MSAEFEDVLTNQPVVIDNVIFVLPSTTRGLSFVLTGLRDYQSRFRWSRSSEMLFSVIVRLHSAMMNWLELNIIHLDLSVGRPKHVRVMAGALEGDVFIGRRAQEFRGLLKIKYPMEHGIVTDWDDMERIWSWIYAEELGTLSEEV